MEQRAWQLALARVWFANSQSVELVERAKSLAEDRQRGQRIAEGLCPACYYLRVRVGGSAITRRPCGACGEPQTYASTATDVLCSPCAKSYGLCRRCGADLDYKNRRTLKRKR